MRKGLIGIVITAILFLFTNCDEGETPLESKISGSWIVVDADLRQTVTEWGLYYVSSLTLYRDHSFTVNNVVVTGIDESISKTGVWEFDNASRSITFYSMVEDAGTIYRDTTEFNVELISNKILILKNEWISIQHKKSKD